MSRYEWEKGEIVLPAAEWAGFKAKIREALNKASEERLGLALKIHAHMSEKHRSAKGYEFKEVARKFVETINRSSYYTPSRYTESDVDAAIEATLNDKERLRKPLKKDFPAHGNNVSSFEDEDCSLHFDNESRKATWYVHENNHACDTAHDSALGKAFFAALSKVKWTRGSGGRIWGNDEYNRDSGRDYEGSGSSYNKRTFGPEVKTPPQSRGFALSGYRGPRW